MGWGWGLRSRWRKQAPWSSLQIITRSCSSQPGSEHYLENAPGNQLQPCQSLYLACRQTQLNSSPPRVYVSVCVWGGGQPPPTPSSSPFPYVFGGIADILPSPCSLLSPVLVRLGHCCKGGVLSHILGKLERTSRLPELPLLPKLRVSP